MKSVKAEDVLKRYEAGERDFRRLNLSGQSFKGKNLSGADFSEADIRGTNFTSANLKGSKFCGAKAGLQYRQAILLLFLAFLLATGIGLITGLIGFFAFSLQASENIKGFISSLIVTIILISILFFSVVSWGYEKAQETRGRNILVDISLALGFLGNVVLVVSLVLTFSNNFNMVVALALFSAMVLAVAVLLVFIVAGCWYYRWSLSCGSNSSRLCSNSWCCGQSICRKWSVKFERGNQFCYSLRCCYGSNSLLRWLGSLSW